MGRSDGHVPPDYIDYLIMDHFRCLPSELDKEDNKRLIQFLWIKGIVNETLEKERKKQETIKKPYGRH